ncbi:MAG: hypothetical protein V3U66_02070, partial [Acidobacteriota bacterium]
REQHAKKGMLSNHFSGFNTLAIFTYRLYLFHFPENGIGKILVAVEGDWIRGRCGFITREKG